MNALQLLAASAGLSMALLSGEASEPGHAAPAAHGEPTPAATPVKKATTEKSSEARKVGEKAAEKAPEKATEKASEKTSEKSALKIGNSEASDLWTSLMEGNHRFVEGHLQEHELLKSREELSQGQHPGVMILGCADSRVSPELVFDQNIGDLFVVRVAGNVAEPSAIGSLEYGFEHLQAHVLVILGHERCGAVAAAASGEWMPSANLYDITKRISPALANVERCRDATEFSNRQVRANVEQCSCDLIKQSPILAKAVAEGELTVVRAVYHIKSGEVEKIEAKGPSIASLREEGGH